jgi:excisionase family DNA binding protein
VGEKKEIKMQKTCRKLLRIREAVQYVDGVVTEKTFRQWIWKRKIETVRIGGTVCIPAEALDALIEAGRVPAVTNGGSGNRRSLAGKVPATECNQ